MSIPFHVPYRLRGWVIPNPKSITLRLKLALGLLIAAVCCVSCASLLYVRQAHIAALSIEQTIDAVQGSRADVAILLERHRRFVEAAQNTSAPTTIESSRQQAEHLNSFLTGLFRSDKDQAFKQHGAKFASLAMLGRAAFSAAQINDTAARDTALKSYVALSNELHDAVRNSRKAVLQQTASAVEHMARSGESVQWWVVTMALIAMLLIGPLSLWTIAKTMRRINHLTNGMLKIASNDPAIAITSLADQDELGDMARALEVFKTNTATAAGNAKEIRRLNEWFDMALNNMAHGLSMFSADGQMLVCNRRYLELYKLPDHLGVPGTALSDIAAHWNASLAIGTQVTNTNNPDAWFYALQRALAKGKPFSQRHEIGDGRIVVVHVQPLSDGGWVDVHEDITDTEVAEKQIEKLARFDPLTELANRRYFQELLETSLIDMPIDHTLAVLWLDLDRFKYVNDTFGHPTGDALLRMVADRLRKITRGSDVVSRLGGDEFAIIMQTASNSRIPAEVVGNRIIEALKTPFEISGQIIKIGASIGVAIAPQHGHTPDDLLHHADIALYRAKTAGRGSVVFYSNEFEKTIKARRQLEVDLRNAAAKGELTLHYQPIIDLSEQSVVACEALMRWNHKDLGMIPPSDFIPMAEEIGLIEDLGAWAIEQACQDAVTWPGDIRVAVNLSADQFAKAGLVDVTARALERTGLPAHRLEFEVTETLLLQDNVGTLTTLQALSERGVGIALDDFGTGYASLSYLSRLPFDKIKIDQSFIRAMPNGGDSATIVRAIADLAHTLGMRIVAEGVETTRELAEVQRAGCDEVQGYYFSAPVPASRLPEIIAACNGRLHERAA